MRKLAILLSLPIILFSCGSEEKKSVDAVLQDGDLSEIRQKKSELSKEQSELTRQINRLDEAINELDVNRSRPLVNIETVRDTVFKHYAEVQGDVATDQNIVIYPETSGILSDVRVSEGQEVSRGQTLAVVDDGGLSSELARLETQLSLAETTFERQERLWNQNIGSEMQYLEAKSNFESAQNSVNQLRTQLAKSTIKAPFSGIIDEVITEQGEVVSPGQSQLFRLVSLQNMYVEANVPENYLNQVSAGSEVIVQINSIGKEFTGEVKRVGNTINPNNRTFRIEVAIPNEDKMVRPNQIATLRINDYTNEDAIVVPENAVQQNSQGNNLVYIWESQGENTGTAREVNVETGYVAQGVIEITSGLEPGTTIITDGSRNLRDGQEIKTRN
ncbi:efflux RND transporter periplasmic adaptor subunit [Salegentibacter sp. F188]|uniref:Efflux RND transporter periplasmic adaptor subunit n=1 Tax=Autumnicola patrickiae TaxID=3075591 RepID=A0ABU3E8V6_9FLAO|nr:efflux RND transporter periplasmic adaptor subunit [Salegentibacter sp. F188]MDT0691677.1 efflux RND transporter periplasmic adaptor subunit [Salegentibacter sp. F188]